MRAILTAFIVLTCAACARGEMSVDMPLKGNFRIGRYMPVHVTADACERMTVEGAGLMPLTINARGTAIDSVFPVLVIGPLTEITLRDDKGNE